MEQKNLVIVESPAKAKTIKKYLGKNFEVLASYGHVRDLVPKEGAVDPKRKFAMRYQILEKNEKHVHAIARALKKSDALYLATDPDREGEAISWHLVELLKELNVLDGKDVHRVVFYEITRNAIREAISQPRHISQDLVNAQQARRALDYLVGFNLSPLLWKKAGLPGASAGRVQSPALRMICEREEEIARFKPREYWTVDADVEKAQQGFPARLIEYRGEKVEQFTVTDRATGRRTCAPRSKPPQPARSALHRSSASSAAAIPRRRSLLQRCSRNRHASSASAHNARCVSRSSCTKASISAKAPSASSRTCARTRSTSRTRPCRKSARLSSRTTARSRCPKRRASTRPSRRTRRKRTRRSDRRPRRSRRSGSKARSIPTSSSCTA